MTAEIIQPAKIVKRRYRRRQTPIAASPGAGNLKSKFSRKPPNPALGERWLAANDPNYATRLRAERRRKRRATRSSRTYPLR